MTEKRCGYIDIQIGARVPNPNSLQCSITEWSYPMLANAMNVLDRTAMVFVVFLAATPMLSIAASAVFL